MVSTDIGVGLDPFGATRLKLMTMPSILDSKWLWEERLVNPSVIVLDVAISLVDDIAARAAARMFASKEDSSEAAC